jgi:SDR family mycofactocin-dependent oxidoreductase
VSSQLESRVAIVTGAARGQGRSHALALAREGATIVALDVPASMKSPAYPLGSREDLDETVRLITEIGAVGVAEAADVRDAAAVAGVVDRCVERFGRVDILVANAGIVGNSAFWDITDEAWDEMVATNLSGVFYCFRSVLGPMRERGYGRIVVTSSMGGRAGIPNLSHYAATKWGVIGLAKSLALEVATEGITVNVVCPSTVGTTMVLNENTYRLFAPELADPTVDDVAPRFQSLNPIPQPWLVPEDVSRAVLHFVTDPGVMTGAVIEIALGISATMH